MERFFQRDILIVCSCGSLRPFNRLSFCRYCVVLRCGYCVCHEVDSIYCSNCLENLASSEARLKKNRCGSCFSCPYCFHSLSIRAATVSRINLQAGDKSTLSSKTSVKNYYLSCFFCRWSTRDAKMPDQTTSTSNNWPEHKNTYAERISSLLEHYKMIMFREKMEKENRMLLQTSRRGYQHFSEKFGLTAMLARKRAGLPPLSLGRDDSSIPPQVTPAEASEDVEPLSKDIFTKPVDILQLTSLPQRFVIPDLQPELISELFPIHKQLSVKRSQRCKSCLHNIFKPEYGPASIKFKIYSAASYYVPEIRLMQKIKVKPGERAELRVKVINPAQFATNVRFLQLADVRLVLRSTDVVAACQKQDIDAGERKSIIIGVAPPIQEKMYSLENPRSVNVVTNGKIMMPDIIINLPPRDDITEYDDIGDSNTKSTADNPAIIWRRGNKVIVEFVVTADDNLQAGDEIKVGFIMRFTYCDKIISPLEQKGSKDVDVDVIYFLNVGNIEEPETVHLTEK